MSEGGPHPDPPFEDDGDLGGGVPTTVGQQPGAGGTGGMGAPARPDLSGGGTAPSANGSAGTMAQSADTGGMGGMLDEDPTAGSGVAESPADDEDAGVLD